ncbi:DNA cytosine methyltransferase [Roseisolibacter agri]|uniref:DNA (cytosine-5-)-methyltransferase n=1 Tax=Roseisolibacter agri TaxID=2014610 RepID=A0AA37V1K0_9BACT|nr:DNA cytosine methyltransferase [Roseisolibacter agri]GLC26350.1 cytosine-specific methyltransferase [Roseisolibacter agri]
MRNGSSADPVAIELFAGCGGLSTGVLDAGFRVALGTDYYAPTMRTYAYNHEYRGSRALTADARALTGASLMEAAGLAGRRPALLAGGPPCQPFSVIGKRQGLADPRGDLVLEYVRLLRELQPDGFIFENVAHLETVAEGVVLDRILSELTDAGYASRHAVLSAAEFGVPQMRKRLFIVGARGKKAPPFPPMPTHGDLALLGQSPLVTCRDALDDLPDVESPEAALIPNHEPTHHSPAMLDAFRALEPGRRDKKSHHDRLHPDRPGYTLRAGTGNFSPLRPVHYRYDRVISVRESARLQSFADSFIWPHDVPRLQQYRQVGNAVPPKLAAAVVRHLAAFFGWTADAEVTKGDERLRDPFVPACAKQRAEERRSRIRGASLGRP